MVYSAQLLQCQKARTINYQDGRRGNDPLRRRGARLGHIELWIIAAVGLMLLLR